MRGLLSQYWCLVGAWQDCGEQLADASENLGQATTKFVTTGFDTRGLESEGWRKIHDNVLVGAVPRP